MSWRGYYYVDLICPHCNQQLLHRVKMGKNTITCEGMEAYGQGGFGCGKEFEVKVQLEITIYKKENN